ncbi:hypothetical protein EUGRSUZ_H03696 [Eucalyptus grandis]|uniref:Uncharacterized protein n=2 Tax=Eucalyptus grandis TaxID=71139 RepID=A0ACC3JVK4_EUCGR|nr:hypothetical protein EUGRSUZ_H03696 [Eucalyptus grandis]
MDQERFFYLRNPLELKRGPCTRSQISGFCSLFEFKFREEEELEREVQGMQREEGLEAIDPWACIAVNSTS